MLKILVIENIPPTSQNIWWKGYLEKYKNIKIDILKVGQPKEINDFLKLFKIGLLMYKCLKKSQYDLIITFECGWETFLLSFYQSLFFKKKPAHIILDFIMREKTEKLYSRLKYIFMKFCFSSVALVVCSSSSERDYYIKVFNWKQNKAVFIPLYVRPLFFKFNPSNGDYIFSAGRTFRDYETLLKAVKGLPTKVIIVASRKNLEDLTVPIPHNVTIRSDIPLAEYAELLAKSKFVVLPLQERVISVGQLVLLESMALGKATIVTKAPGIMDYVIDNVTGLLVNPKKPKELREKIMFLLNHPELINSLGRAAKEKIIKYHQIEHYITKLCKILKQNHLL